MGRLLQKAKDKTVTPSNPELELPTGHFGLILLAQQAKMESYNVDRGDGSRRPRRNWITTPHVRNSTFGDALGHLMVLLCPFIKVSEKLKQPIQAE